MMPMARAPLSNYDMRIMAYAQYNIYIFRSLLITNTIPFFIWSNAIGMDTFSASTATDIQLAIYTCSILFSWLVTEHINTVFKWLCSCLQCSWVGSSRWRSYVAKVAGCSAPQEYICFTIVNTRKPRHACSWQHKGKPVTKPSYWHLHTRTCALAIHQLRKRIAAYVRSVVASCLLRERLIDGCVYIYRLVRKRYIYMVRELRAIDRWRKSIHRVHYIYIEIEDGYLYFFPLRSI